MFQLRCLFVILFVGQHYAAGYLGQDYEYVVEADTWLRLHMSRDYWTDARRFCQLEGGLLASPSTTALAEAMLRIMSSLKVDVVFIGIHALITEGDYESLDGVPLSKIPLDWDDKPNEDINRPDYCVVLNATGKVNDRWCTNTYPYFCRKDTAVMNSAHVCQTTVSGYELKTQTGSCYKFHPFSTQWHRAARVCRADGAHLAIINSNSESQVLQDIFKKCPKPTIIGAENNDAALISVWKWSIFYNGEWQTGDGNNNDYVIAGQHYAVGYLGHDYEYVAEADTWLRLHMWRDCWTDARRLCQLEGGLLASPSTTALAEAMLRIMSSHKVSVVFTGIHALITEGDYESLDGVPLSEIPLDWAHDKPNEHYNRLKLCVALNATGKVNDVGCTYTYPFFCRKDTTVMNATHECQTTVSGYELKTQTGSCYKFHAFSRKWHRAARVCRAEGAHLAIINSNSESQVLQEIFKNYPKATIIGAENNDAALIGVWKWDIFYKGEWQTVDGETLEKAGFAQWSDELMMMDGTMNENYHAAAVKRSGLLVPVSRYDKYPFICEITP